MLEASRQSLRFEWVGQQHAANVLGVPVERLTESLAGRLGIERGPGWSKRSPALGVRWPSVRGRLLRRLALVALAHRRREAAARFWLPSLLPGVQITFGTGTTVKDLTAYREWLRVAEDCGSRLLTTGDSQSLWADPFVATTVAALETTRPRLGITVSNPRHPPSGRRRVVAGRAAGPLGRPRRLRHQLRRLRPAQHRRGAVDGRRAPRVRRRRARPLRDGLGVVGTGATWRCAGRRRASRSGWRPRGRAPSSSRAASPTASSSRTPSRPRRSNAPSRTWRRAPGTPAGRSTSSRFGGWRTSCPPRPRPRASTRSAASSGHRQPRVPFHPRRQGGSGGAPGRTRRPHARVRLEPPRRPGHRGGQRRPGRPLRAHGLARPPVDIAGPVDRCLERLHEVAAARRHPAARPQFVPDQLGFMRWFAERIAPEFA